ESGICHPPRSNPPRRSSPGPPSPCMTPSSDTDSVTVSFMVVSFPLFVSWVEILGRRQTHRWQWGAQGTYAPSIGRRVTAQAPVRPDLRGCDSALVVARRVVAP